MPKKLITTNSMGELVMRRFVRRFNGNTINGNNFDKAHLKAYLKGYQNFRYGYDNEGNPIWYKVQGRLFVEETPLQINTIVNEQTD
jgi:hypothetical protein